MRISRFPLRTLIPALFACTILILLGLYLQLEKTTQEYLRFLYTRTFHPPKKDIIPTDGVKLYFESYGEGEPVILIHGMMGSIESFFAQIPTLSEHYQIIALDNRGHGRSTDQNAPLSYSVMANDVVDLMKELNLEKCHIIGWGDGGNIGLEMAIQYPELVDKLILMGANFSPKGLTPQCQQSIQASILGLEQPKALKFYQQKNPDPENALVVLNKMKNTVLFEPQLHHDDLADIKAKTLILNGEKEQFIKMEHTLEMNAHIPNSELKFIPDADHFAPIDKFEEVNQEILQFLKE